MRDATGLGRCVGSVCNPVATTALSHAGSLGEGSGAGGVSVRTATKLAVGPVAAAAGSAAAAKSDAAAVKAACNQCHTNYKEKYRKDFPTRALP